MKQAIAPFSVLSIAKVLEDVLSGMNVLDRDSYGLYLLCAIVIPGESLVVEDGRENCSGGSLAL
jgi:hypothetical protein